MKVPLTKITIVAERLLKDELIRLIRKNGARGFTLTLVEGEGSRGVRASEWEGRNVRIETIVSDANGNAILEDLAETYFENYAVIAWSSEVNVLRGQKFVQE